MRFYEPTLQLGAFSRRPDSSQLTLYPQPRRNKGLSYNTDAEDMAHVLAKLHNFDVVYIAGMDRKFLKAGHAFAFATNLRNVKVLGPLSNYPQDSKLDTIASTR
ncbi:hypothetical protein RAB80_017142 [Fusarium oxysporum f. sp. vasinfectum]|uniref:Uncharacterized protein n=1 Tax=Fusarium oxysporum f. sp. melonis 26406 TaxID=1089452 RepID=W9Z508_FUSOX|nr:hypothetical protein FOMG_19543 [Fusarium oxysporum f. sp. melonis 26406]KAK2667951.1 hypothetical protein RAB80_017142 [Fusarium oxysporum f. sp. vasinfectum]